MITGVHVHSEINSEYESDNIGKNTIKAMSQDNAISIELGKSETIVHYL